MPYSKTSWGRRGILGEPEAGGSRTQYPLRLPPDVYQALKKLGGAKRRSINSLILQAIAYLLEREGMTEFSWYPYPRGGH